MEPRFSTGASQTIPNAPFANVEMDASANNDYSAKGYSDANGNYAVAILGVLPMNSEIAA